MKKLNLGCGSQVPNDWVNVDYSLGARLMKVPFFSIINRKLKLFNLNWNENIYLHDLTKKLPWNESTIDIIYSSHTLEHFSKKDGLCFLIDCHRVLRKDGIIRILVPDLRCNVTEYMEGRVNADDFIVKLDVLYSNNKNPIKRKLAPFFEYPHKCMYDNSRLLDILNNIGFDASIRSPFESNIDDIHQVEVEGRTRNAVIVEGRKK